MDWTPVAEPLGLLILVFVLLYYWEQGQCIAIGISLCCAVAHWQRNGISLFRSLAISSDSVLTSLKSSRTMSKRCSWELYFLVQLPSPGSNRIPVLSCVSFPEAYVYYASCPNLWVTHSFLFVIPGKKIHPPVLAPTKQRRSETVRSILNFKLDTKWVVTVAVKEEATRQQ